jgi:hypothetical protein
MSRHTAIEKGADLSDALKNNYKNKFVRFWRSFVFI